jgi:hypothetical protein
MSWVQRTAWNGRRPSRALRAGRCHQPRTCSGLRRPVLPRRPAKAGSGSMLDGGRVLKNQTDGTTASRARDPEPSPPCCDAEGIMQAATSDPAGLARDRQLRFSDRDLAPTHAIAASPTPSRSSTPICTRAYGIVWGDGSTTIEQRRNRRGHGNVEFDHTYPAAPDQPLRVSVLENARLSELDRNLESPSRSSGHKEVDGQPTPGPEHVYR